MWMLMIAKAILVSMMLLVKMETAHLLVNVPLDGLGNFVIQVNAYEILLPLSVGYFYWFMSRIYFFGHSSSSLCRRCG